MSQPSHLGSQLSPTPLSSTLLSSMPRLAGAMLLLGSMLLPNNLAIAQTQSGTNQPGAAASRFTCDSASGAYTVMYNPVSRPGESYAWANPGELGGGWTPARRCAEISRRLEFYRPDGLLEMQTAVENGYNTVCVTTEQVPSCRIVLTVPPGQDPVSTRDRVFSNLAVADSGQQTSGVNTFAGNDGGIINRIGQAIGIDLSSLSNRRSSRASSEGINLRPFLDQADGGTGERLD